MPHPLQLRIAGVRQRARRLLLVHGASWAAGLLVAAAMFLGGLDYLFHIQDQGLRFISSACLLALMVWIWRRYLAPALWAPLGDREIAARIERRFPKLGDQLISTVEFLTQTEDDPEAGSPALRRAVVANTTAEMENMDLGLVIEPRPVKWVALAAIAIGVVALALIVLNPSAARIALTRLALPWSDVAWPQRNHLRLEGIISRVALGQPFQVRVIDDGGALPDEVRIEYRYPGQAQVEVDRMLAAEPGVVFARKEKVSRPFEYRAVGGDDQSMAWAALQVVDPPKIESLSIQLIYPEYLGLGSATRTGHGPESSDQHGSDPHVRAIEGTRVVFQGKSSKPLASATLRIGELDRPAVVAADHHGFSVDFTVQKSGSYWFRLVDDEGFLGGDDRRYEIRAIPDEKPVVNIEQPNNNISVTTQAQVPLKIVAKDDLALKEMILSFGRSEEPKTVIPLFRGPDRVTVDPRSPPGLAAGGERKVVDHLWKLAEYGFQPGDSITFLATATDYKPQSSNSHPRILQIVTPEQLLDQIGRRQGLIREKLEQMLRIQSDARENAHLVETRLSQLGRFNKDDHDALQAAELTQRQVERGLKGTPDAISQMIDELLADLANNRLDDPVTVERMTELSREIDRLAKDHLPPIDRELTSALKVSQQELNQPEKIQPAVVLDVTASLKATGEHQDEVIRTLQTQLKGLSRWDDVRRFRGDLSEIQRDQTDLAQRTAELLPKLLNPAEDRQQLESELIKNVERQKDLATRFERILPRMEQALGPLQKSDPETAETLADALNEARERAVGGQMRTAARTAEKRQVGQAAQLQRKVAADLQEMLDVLTHRREQGLAQLVKKLKAAERELSEFRQKQQQLARQSREAGRQPNAEDRKAELERLARRQQQLEQDVQRFARELKRLEAEQASRSSQDAGSKMGEAGKQAQQGNAEGAGEKAEAAEKDLADAAKKLAQRRQQAEMDLAFEQLSKIKDALASLKTRQEQVVADTERLEALRAAQQGKLEDPQRDSLRSVESTQRLLQRETETLREKLTSAEVFSLALKGAAGEMQQAADRLKHERTDVATQMAERSAARRFAQLIEALKNDPPENKPNEGGAPDDGDGAPSNKPPGDGVPALAQVKMLKFLQTEINLRTKELEDSIGAQTSKTEEQQREILRLSEEQGVLADMVRNMLKRDADLEDNPDQIPDL